MAITVYEHIYFQVNYYYKQVSWAIVSLKRKDISCSIYDDLKATRFSKISLISSQFFWLDGYKKTLVVF